MTANKRPNTGETGSAADANRKSSATWRDVLAVHPAAALFPQMSPGELQALGEDIKINGLTSQVMLRIPHGGESAELLDGRNRLDAMEAAGLPTVKDGRLVDGLFVLSATDTDPVAYVISANIHRRHLTAAQKRELIAKLLKAQPDKSDRQIAETVKASHHTVGAVRADMEGRGQVAHVAKRKDTKGRSQPAKKSPKPSSKPMRAVRDDIGPTSQGEAERLRARVEELENEKRRLEIANSALRSEIEELKARLAATELQAAARAFDGGRA